MFNNSAIKIYIRVSLTLFILASIFTVVNAKPIGNAISSVTTHSELMYNPGFPSLTATNINIPLKKLGEIWFIVAAVVIALAFAIILWAFRYSSRVKRDLQDLKTLNKKVSENQVQLEQAMKELEFRDKDKSRILRSVAHDVMSPIAAIAALTDILIGEWSERPAEEQEMLRLIQEACNNSLQLSKDILDAAVTIAPGDLNKELVDIFNLSREV